MLKCVNEIKNISIIFIFFHLVVSYFSLPPQPIHPPYYSSGSPNQLQVEKIQILTNGVERGLFGTGGS